MRKRLSLPIPAGLVLAAPAGGELVAEQLTVDNAATHLFGGTDSPSTGFGLLRRPWRPRVSDLASDGFDAQGRVPGE